MQRQIKFRAWDGKHMINPFCELKEGNRFWGEDLTNTHYGDIQAVMQFTGLLDKNGKEIYEGDVCKVLYTDWPSKSEGDNRSIEEYLSDISKVGVVEFVGYEWCFRFGQKTKWGIDYGTFIVGQHGMVEVIGNVFENPELLNQ